MQHWGICYKAALRSQGQYKDEVYIVDEGTLQELTVELPDNLLSSCILFFCLEFISSYITIIPIK